MRRLLLGFCANRSLARCLCMTLAWFVVALRPALASQPEQASAPDLAHGNWPVARAPADDLEPLSYDPQLVEALPRELLQDYPATYLVYREQHALQPDGKEVTVVQQLLRLNNRLAVEELAEQQIEFLPSSQTLVLHTARLHTADGKRVELLAHQAHVRDANTDFKVYDQAQQLVLSFPARTPGDVLEIQYSVIDANPQAAGQMFDMYLFGHQNLPVGNEELVLRLPADRTLRYATRGLEQQPAIERMADEVVYRWRLHGTLPAGEEERMPPASSLLPCLAYSTFASWEEVAEFNRRVRQDLTSLTPELQRLAAELAPPHAPALQKAQRLAAWVRDHIRYLSANHEPQGYSPHPPAKVCADGYGDCKDKCQLLLELLQHVGVPASLAFLNTDEEPQVFDEVPSPGVDHVIVLAEIDGQQIWIDPTGSLAPWNVLSPSVCGRRAFVWDGQSIRLLTTPMLRAEQTRVDQESELVLDPSGTGRWRVRRTLYGQEAWTARENLLAQNAAQRRQNLAGEFQGVYRTARLLEFNLDESVLADPDQPLTLQAEFEIADMAAGAPALHLQVANVLSHGLLAEDVSPARRWPYLLDWPLEVRHRISVVLPVAYVFGSLPEHAFVHSKWGNSTLTVSAGPDPRRLQIEWQLCLEQTRIEPGEVPEFLDFAQQVSELAVVYLELVPTSDPADVPALLDALSRNEADAPTARVLAALLIDEGEQDQARHVLARALAATPEDAALWELLLECLPAGEDALDVHRKLAEHWPTEGTYLLQLALALLEAGQTAEARETLQRLAALEDPVWQVEGRYQLARLHAAAGEDAKAADELAAARQADPSLYGSHVQARLLEGQLALKAGLAQRAREVFDEALQADAAAAEVRLGLAQAWRALGDARRAWHELDRYLSQEDVGPDGLIEAAELALALGQRSAALLAAERALDAMPDFAPAQRMLTRACHVLGRWEQAVNALGEDTPLDDAATAKAFLESALRAGRLSAAVKRIAEVQSILPQAEPQEQRPELERLLAAVAYCERRLQALAKQLGTQGSVAKQAHGLEAMACAEWLAGQGDWVRAEKLAVQARSAGLRLPGLDALTGLVLLHTGQLREARKRAAKALQQTEDPMACFLRGRLRYELQQEGAVSDLRKAAELTEHEAPMVLHALAAALAAEGELTEALKVQREAAALAPQHRQVQLQLSRLQAQGEHGRKE